MNVEIGVLAEDLVVDIALFAYGLITSPGTRNP